MSRMYFRAKVGRSVVFPTGDAIRAVRRCFTLVLIAAAIIAVSNRPVVAQTWARTYGLPWDEIANSIVQTTDGGIAIAGYTASMVSGGSFPDSWVLKLNSAGGVQWQWAVPRQNPIRPSQRRLSSAACMIPTVSHG